MKNGGDRLRWVKGLLNLFRRRRVERGTLPTPEDPYPSNQTVEWFADGTCMITQPEPTPRVLREYRNAIEEHPESPELHMHYGIALLASRDYDQAMREFQRAIEIDPESDFAHGQLAHLYEKTGDIENEIKEHREALRLMLIAKGEAVDQGEAIYRWCLAGALRRSGQAAEARDELNKAVAVEREAVKQGVGSEQLLGQLEEEQRKYA